jgi:hypothetical protein
MLGARKPWSQLCEKLERELNSGYADRQIAHAEHFDADRAGRSLWT